jgi:HSP20 family protein
MTGAKNHIPTLQHRLSRDVEVDMILTRTDPLNAVDRIFEQVFGSAGGAQGATMAMDAVWRGDQLMLAVDLPGVPEDAIELTVADRVLTIAAERRQPADQEGDRWALRERSHGRWTRSVRLGAALDPEKVTAAYADGVLTITIPTSESASPRKISIGKGETPAEAIETTSSN